jgi:hypothetical protein
LMAVVLRLLVLSSVIIAIYVIVGSSLFRDWWYGFFWGRYSKLRYARAGLETLVDLYFGLSMGIIVAFVVTVLAISSSKQWVFPLIDRFAGRIVFCAIAAILMDALVVRHLQPAYAGALNAEEALRQLSDQLKRLESRAAPPTIEVPIYFHYKDDIRIEALYSQIKPELTLTEQTETSTSHGKAKAGMTVPFLNVGLAGGRKAESQAKLEADPYSVDKKCIEVLRFVREKWPGKYYTDVSHWGLRKVYTESPHKALLLHLLDPNRRDFGSPGRNQDTRQPEPSVAQWNTELQNELRLLDGLLFVEGEFEKSATEQSLHLIRRFTDTEQPFQCSFKVVLPIQVATAIPKTNLRLRVFGDVIRGLAEDGFVDVLGIAVF